MQRIARSGFAAITILGLAACTDSSAPTQLRAARSPAAEVSPGTQLCKPCPPGQVCTAVCEETSEGFINPGTRTGGDAPNE